MKQLNILFICKYNRFRSRIAKSYFDQLNKNPNIKTRSGGVIVGSYPLDKEEVKVAKKLGIKLTGRPEPVTTEKLIWQDIIIIVADNVPKHLFDFNTKKYHKKVIIWKIPDIKANEGEKRIEEIIKSIIKKVDDFYKTL